MAPFASDLPDLFGCSRVELVPSGDRIEVRDLREQPRCERSWKRDGTVRERCYWGLQFNRSEEDEKRSFEEWREGLLEQLRQDHQPAQAGAVPRHRSDPGKGMPVHSIITVRWMVQ